MNEMRALEILNIAMSINRAYVNYCIITICSILENTDQILNVYILNSDLDKSDEKYMNNKLSKYHIKVKLNFIFLDRNNLNLTNFKNYKAHLSIETFYRLLLPKVLKDLDKIIYIDSDIIFKEDISKLDAIDIDEFYIGAVKDCNLEMESYLHKTNFPGYFNAGLMIMNLDKMRKTNFTERCLEFYETTSLVLPYADQDILNYIIQDEWYCLEQNWNVIRQWAKKDLALYEIYKDDYIESIINNPPYTIHYTSSIKPWSFLCDHPLKKEFIHYQELSGVEISYNSQYNFFNKMDILIFGAGSGGINMYELLRERSLDIVGFIDNNKRKVGGGLFKGKPVWSISAIEKKHFIIIASDYYKEIALQLDDLGLIRNLDYVIGIEGVNELSEKMKK